MDISCIVLAGGKSSRLGRNKVAVTIAKRTLLDRVISRLASLNSDIIVVTAREPTIPQSIDYPKIKVVSDVYPGKGSLGGIYTGLKATKSFYNIVVACDMPFLNMGLLNYMLDIAEGFDFVIPRWDDSVEPLHAVYSRNCLAPIEDLLKKDTLRIVELFSLVKMRYVEEEEINRFDPEHLSFFNINTEADLKKAVALAGREGDSID